MPDPREGRSGVPTIEALRALQRRLNLLDVHLVYLDSKGFEIVHTDVERALADKYPAAMPLEDCELHQWLQAEDGPPEKVGFYVVTPHEVDAYSEPYPVARFDFTPLEARIQELWGDATGGSR